ncbi:Pollen allergen ole e 6 [Corchorus capsularis]|uniref:Pollen allergen ole e 6 n=1 Tax=Corchorus capsularis TaxID=210143 RepID=A0A1R3IE11_COCAP|nr:Pollen allergen ole e 6 [Corchorus capsularis]
MAKKVVALLVMCLVVVAAVQLPSASALDQDGFATAHEDDKFSSCFKICHKECTNAGAPNTLCEMKCDGECFSKGVKDKLPNIQYGLIQ